MQSLFLPAVVLFQDDYGVHRDTHLAMIFTGIVALALVMQAFLLGAAAIYAARQLARVTDTVKRIEERTGPVVDKLGVAVTDLIPKVHVISANVEGLSYTLRARVDEIGATVSQWNETVQDINGRTRLHVARVDGIVTHAVTATEEISETVAQGIKAPIRQIVGVLAGLRAGLDTLIARSPFGR